MFLDKYSERINKFSESQQEYIKKNVVPILDTHVNDMEKEQEIENERAKQHEINEKDYKNNIDELEKNYKNKIDELDALHLKMKKELDSKKRKRGHEIDSKANNSYDRLKKRTEEMISYRYNIGQITHMTIARRGLKR